MNRKFFVILHLNPLKALVPFNQFYLNSQNIFLYGNLSGREGVQPKITRLQNKGDSHWLHRQTKLFVPLNVFYNLFPTRPKLGHRV